ncbi:MAG: M64 family metallo-endopeptidase [Bacteroidia bacterium]|nr:M64 family metallo-endopeptidase [Bacteroidia bacterium]
MLKIFPGLMILLLAFSCSNKPAEKQATAAIPAPLPAYLSVNKGNLEFTAWFLDKTMRVDYFHSGTAAEEHFSPDRTVSDGPWPGSKKILIDELEMGPYFFEVCDQKTKTLLYSRGFASVFGEWQSIPEAGEQWGTFHESVRFPWPKEPVVLILKKRDTLNSFKQIWMMNIDPASRKVNPADQTHMEKVDVVQENGPASEKVDIVLLGDGYASGDMEKFRADAKRMSDILLSAEPFKSNRARFNIRAVETPGPESGVCKPHPGVFKRTPLSVQYGAFDSERYALTYDNKTIRDAASAVPYDFMVIMINERTYGGGGIYGLYTTVSVDNKFAPYIMIHEMGHHLAALADEYYTSSVSYEMPEIKVEPWERNITALFDKTNLKWKDLLETGMPVPTPWNKEEFDKFGYRIQKERDSLRAAKVPEEVMEALFQRQYDQEDQYFSREKYRTQAGAFEGAGYMAKGLYRSQIDCIMYTRHLEFCKVCRRTIEEVIGQYSN